MGSPVPGGHDLAMKDNISLDSAIQSVRLSPKEKMRKPEKQTINIDVLSVGN